ncbi:fatty acid desaturase family protein [Aurantibacillus circumpalustris]|uniref:fatty acid desaturase family protein n=1 Tax=Aurantibacillus circumpalustris TaxID=3036359 RepID=UPI00295A614A|nr:acyl-CoA desaturase [Aurantibacillus circumpalustris]
MSKTALRFNNGSNRTFQNELRKRVDAYFKENKISKHGNIHLYLKTVVMFAAYLVPYFLITFHVFESKSIWLLLSVLMGLGMAGIGMGIMHDANHGSYSKNDRFNKFLGFFSISLLSGNSLNWRIQHNIIHHTYTNVHDHDEDIAPVGMLRFDPHSEKKKIHKFQFLYAWFFYGLMTLMWSTVKDFRQLKRYNKGGYLKTANTTFAKELAVIIVSKVLYFAYMLIPYFVIQELSFLNWLTGYLVMHYVAGLTLAMVFQVAHVTEENEFPLPNEEGELENNFIEHQLRTTMNFSMDSKIVSYFVGGLNFQVEHHLFPGISHVHYPKIAKIVATTAQEFNIPYNYEKTFAGALFEHTKMLYKLGK